MTMTLSDQARRVIMESLQKQRSIERILNGQSDRQTYHSDRITAIDAALTELEALEVVRSVAVTDAESYEGTDIEEEVTDAIERVDAWLYREAV